MAIVAGICLTGFTANAQDEMQPPLFTKLAHNFKVTGSPCVQTFVEALPVYSKEFGWYNDPEIDNKNGYFSYSEEGAGGIGSQIGWIFPRKGKNSSSPLWMSPVRSSARPSGISRR